MVKGIVNEMEDLQFNSKENFAVYMKSIEEKYVYTIYIYIYIDYMRN